MPSGDNEATVPVQRRSDRHVAARGRTVHDFQRRRVAPCRNVSESTAMLDVVAALTIQFHGLRRWPEPKCSKNSRAPGLEARKTQVMPGSAPVISRTSLEPMP